MKKFILLSLHLIIVPSLYCMNDFASTAEKEKLKAEIMIKSNATHALECYQGLKKHNDFFTSALTTLQLAQLTLKNDDVVTAIQCYAFRLCAALKLLIRPLDSSGTPVRIYYVGCEDQDLMRKFKKDASICSTTSDRIRLKLVGIRRKNRAQQSDDLSIYADKFDEVELNRFKFNFLALLENEAESIQPLKNLLEKPLSISVWPQPRKPQSKGFITLL